MVLCLAFSARLYPCCGILTLMTANYKQMYISEALFSGVWHE